MQFTDEPVKNKLACLATALPFFDNQNFITRT